MFNRQPRLVAPLKWHGGKHYLAARIVDLMPPHLHYVEPYFGGGSVLLAKDPEGVSEIANDLNGPLTNFWHTIACPRSYIEFARRADALPFSERHYDAAVERLAHPCETPDHNCITCALAFFLVCRMSLAGRMRSFAPATKTRTRRGMNGDVSAWLKAVDGLPAVHARLRRVRIHNRPALDVIRQEDGPGTLFYLDPPYLFETRASTGEYQHEMTVSDHRQLLDTLRGVKGRFLLSGYPSPLYEAYALEQAWRHADFDLANHAAGGESKRRMIERLWMNFDPQTRGAAA